MTNRQQAFANLVSTCHSTPFQHIGLPSRLGGDSESTPGAVQGSSVALAGTSGLPWRAAFVRIAARGVQATANVEGAAGGPQRTWHTTHLMVAIEKVIIIVV